jgi:hypothetical protein
MIPVSVLVQSRHWTLTQGLQLSKSAYYKVTCYKVTYASDGKTLIDNTGWRGQPEKPMKGKHPTKGTYAYCQPTSPTSRRMNGTSLQLNCG